MREVAALLGEGDEVGEDHPSEAYVVEGIDGARLDVLVMVLVETLRDRLLQVVQRHHRLQVPRQLPHLQPLDLVEEAPHRHETARIENLRSHRSDETLGPSERSPTLPSRRRPAVTVLSWMPGYFRHSLKLHGT